MNWEKQVPELQLTIDDPDASGIGRRQSTVFRKLAVQRIPGLTKQVTIHTVVGNLGLQILGAAYQQQCSTLPSN